jgi:hypothetical protein
MSQCDYVAEPMEVSSKITPFFPNLGQQIVVLKPQIKASAACVGITDDALQVVA